MRTRSSRLNNGYIGDYTPHDDVNGTVGLNKKYLVNEYSIQSLTWERPSQWRQGPSVSEGEQKIVITNAVYNTDNNFTAFTMTGNFAVDWGDGTTGAFASTATASKNYDKTTYAGLTSDVFRGYKTLNIVITPQAGATFNGLINFALKHPQAGLQSYYSNGYLEIIMSAPFVTGPITVSDTTFNNRSASRLLEHFRWIGEASLGSGGLGSSFIGCFNLKIISAFPSTKNVTDFQSLFHSCHNLEYIPPSICETQNATVMPFMFYLCNALKTVPGTFNTSKAISMTQLFQDCVMLKRIPYIDTSKVTGSNMAGLFAGCQALEEAPPLIDAVSATSVNSLFSGCRNLKNFPKVINTSNVTNFGQMFFACANLESAPYVDTTRGADFSNMFNGSAIRRFDSQWGNTFNMPQATTTANMFRFCRGLERVPDTFVTGVTLTNCSEMFYECYSLTKCPLITDISGCTNFTGMFYNCRALKEIPGMTIGTRASNYGTSTTSTFFQNWNLSSCGMTGFTGANVFFENCSLGATALNAIYSSLAVVGASGAGVRTITVTGNWGTATDNPAIAIAKGWTVTG